jgi:hypothetical protein
MRNQSKFITLMRIRIRIQLITLMQIRILTFNLMRIHIPTLVLGGLESYITILTVHEFEYSTPRHRCLFLTAVSKDVCFVLKSAFSGKNSNFWSWNGLESDLDPAWSIVSTRGTLIPWYRTSGLSQVLNSASLLPRSPQKNGFSNAPQ